MKEYIEMCRKSPVQKEWKPKNGDVVLPLGRDDCDLLIWNRLCWNSGFYIWLPRQEDWQQLYHDQIIYDWNILWCLFFHKEVYGLIWDWDKEKWWKK